MLNEIQEKPKVKQTREIMSGAEVAKYLKLSRSRIHELAMKDEIPHFRVGRRVLFDQADINTWIDELKKA